MSNTEMRAVRQKFRSNDRLLLAHGQSYKFEICCLMLSFRTPLMERVSTVQVEEEVGEAGILARLEEERREMEVLAMEPC